MSALAIFRLVLTLAPVVRQAVGELIKALKAGDEDAARKAYEAARLAAFVAKHR